MRRRLHNTVGRERARQADGRTSTLRILVSSGMIVALLGGAALGYAQSIELSGTESRVAVVR